MGDFDHPPHHCRVGMARKTGRSSPARIDDRFCSRATNFIKTFRPAQSRTSHGARPVSYTHLDVYKRQIRAITTSSEVSEELIKNILAGNAVGVKEKKDVIDFDPSLPLSGNGDFTYQLTMRPFKEGFPSFSNSLGGSPYEGRRIVAVNVSAKTLFEIAHQFPPGIRTALEVADPSKFSWDNKQNIVCLSLIHI